jgi:Mut7-C RNAse domain
MMLLVLTAACMQNVQGPNTATTYIPWVHGQETEKRFVCDVMLEGLARQMRLFGLDALSTQQRGKHQRAIAIRYDLKHTPTNVRARALCQACFTGMSQVSTHDFFAGNYCNLDGTSSALC